MDDTGPCLEAHVLLAAPRHLKWRVALITEVCHCYDDVKHPDKASEFIARSRKDITDLQALEALDPVPQKPEVAALYDTAETSLRILAGGSLRTTNRPTLNRQTELACMYEHWTLTLRVPCG